MLAETGDGRETRQLEDAIALYSGPLLGMAGSAPWLLAPRERLHSRVLRAVADAGQGREATQDWEQAIVTYERGLEIDDLAERFYERLMVCNRQIGRRSEALGVYDRCCRTLAAKLDVTPSAAVVAIAQAIRDDGR
jgi:DNA-binding SARP family transcriptional activator